MRKRNDPVSDTPAERPAPPIVRRRYLPSLGSFATFEVAAKHLSFTLAAQELHVTQAAISQQIRALEKALGAQLFLRKHNALELTAEGETLLGSVTSGLDVLADAAMRVGQRADDRIITCVGTNAAVAFWLRPLAAQFRAQHPDTRFVLLASDENQTLANFAEVDFALLCGNDRCDFGENVLPLFPEVVDPVCAPAYRDALGPLSGPEDLARADLLELHRMHWSSEAISWHPLSWQDWFAQHAPDTVPPAPVLSTNNYSTLEEAAIAGEGVILGWRHLVAGAMARKALIKLFDLPLATGRHYYLRTNPARQGSARFQAFHAFLLSQPVP